MLATIRRFTKTWPARALFVLLVAAFGLWGVAGKLTSAGDDTAVARVDGTRIEPAEVQRDYSREMAQLAKANGADFSPPPLERQQIVREVVQQQVLQKAVVNKVAALGLVVPDAAVRAETFALPAFAGTSGAFDRATFLSVLGRNNLDEASFIKLVRDDLSQRQLLEAVGAGAAAPAVLVDQLFAFVHETRVATAVRFPFAAVKPAVATDAALQRFWANHPRRYASPEYRRIKAVVLSAQTLAGDMAVSEDEIKAYYKAALATYDKPERRSVQVVSTPDEASAEKLAQSWKAGASWAAIQQAASGVGETAIELPAAKQGELPDPALGAAAFAAPIEQVSAPVKGSFGWYVVNVTAITPAVVVSLAQAHDEIRSKLGVLKANDAIDDRANKLEDALAGGGGLDDLPQGLGVAAVAGTLDAQGNTPEGAPAPLPAFPALRDAVVAAAFKGKPGDPVHLDQLAATKDNPGGAYYAVSVESVTPPTPLAYAQVQDRVRADWAVDQQRHTQDSAAAALLAAIKPGAPLVAVALQSGLSAVTLPPISRPLNAQDVPPAGVPVNLVAPLFGMKQGDATEIETPDGFMVAQLQTINDPPVTADAIGADQLRTSLDRSVGADVSQSFIQALSARSKVVVNDRLVQQIAQP